MAITVADNFSYQGKKPLDGRDTFTTLATMKAYAEASVYDGCLSYCDEDGKRYEFKSTNTVDPTTGKWREYSSGGGGETYSDFTGATASTAGAHGLVPAPSAGDDGRVLFGNGTWGALINSPNELPVLFDERGTEYQVGWYVNSSGLKKPVYEKSIIANKSNSIAHNIQNLGDYRRVVDVGFFLPDGTIYSPCFYDGNTFIFQSGFSNTVIEFFFGSGWANTFNKIRIVLRYTKTTDTPQ